MPEWWPALVFGWPGPLLAIALSATGLVRGSAAWLVAAALALAPFSFYLLLTPRFWWGACLPALPLIAAGALSRHARRAAWAPVLALLAVIVWLAGTVVSQPRPY
jgi:hypothetical protein